MTSRIIKKAVSRNHAEHKYFGYKNWNNVLNDTLLHNDEDFRKMVSRHLQVFQNWSKSTIEVEWMANIAIIVPDRPSETLPTEFCWKIYEDLIICIKIIFAEVR